MAVFNQQRLKPAERFKELLIVFIQRLHMETANLRQPAGFIADARNLIETDLENRLDIAFPEHSGRRLDAAPCQVLEADREEVAHLFQRWPDSFKFSQVHEVG